MKKINIYKLIILMTFLITAITAISLHFYISLGYCADVCSYRFLSGYYKPLYYFSFYFSPVALFMTFMSPQMIKRWLFFILLPIILLMLYFLEDISPYASGFYLDDRSTMAQFSMYILAIATLIFVAGHYIVSRLRKNKISGR